MNMVRITEDLVRKKAEHNEGEICSLEELSLHQEDIEKIEHLQNWCKKLQILLLQGNIIMKIENLHKLKCLKYLNLALNNIEVIENLERCESLERLDLTLNFVGKIDSVCNLQNNIHFRELYLTGNPCVDFKGYRSYVIAKLPQITNLDNIEVTRTERFKALKAIGEVEKEIFIDQEKYLKFREEQKIRLKNPPDVEDEEFWKQKSENAPETRVEMAKRNKRRKESEKSDKQTEVRPVRLFNSEGKPLNVNQAKAEFKLEYDDPAEIILDVKTYKFLDSNLVNVDLQPNYVRVRIKGKIFQLVLPEEICVDESNALRSQITGHLLIKMPKLSAKFKNIEKKHSKSQPCAPEETKRPNYISKREYLEIGSEKQKLHEICTITEQKEGFVDNPEVPPLE